MAPHAERPCACTSVSRVFCMRSIIAIMCACSTRTQGGEPLGHSETFGESTQIASAQRESAPNARAHAHRAQRSTERGGLRTARSSLLPDPLYAPTATSCPHRQCRTHLRLTHVRQRLLDPPKPLVVRRHRALRRHLRLDFAQAALERRHGRRVRLNHPLLRGRGRTRQRSGSQGPMARPPR